MSLDNDGAHERCARFISYFARPARMPDKYPHTIHITACGYCFTCMCIFSVRVVKRAPCTTLSNVVSDGDAHKVPASRVERAGGGDGCEDIRCDRCARPSAVRVTGGPRSFSVHHFFPIVSLSELDVAFSVVFERGTVTKKVVW